MPRCTPATSVAVAACPKTYCSRSEGSSSLGPRTAPSRSSGSSPPPAAPFENLALSGKVFGRRAWFGDGGIEYVAFIGLRGDEQLRVARVEARSSDIHANAGYEGEQVYMPFTKMYIGRDDVNEFWAQQGWNLNLAPNGALSNCVYCFLKGVGHLKRVHDSMEKRKKQKVRGFGSTVDTPCDLAWWSRMEQKYGRDLEREKRDRTNRDAAGFIGFFGASSGFSYDALAAGAKNADDLARFADTVLPCDCTE